MVSANNLSVLHNIYPCKASANTIQRCGRVSRTFKGKTKAIVYDYIYDNFIFFNQFYSKKKICRLKAYIECTTLPDYIEDLVLFLQRKFSNKSVRKEDIPKLIPHFSEVIVNIDK